MRFNNSAILYIFNTLYSLILRIHLTVLLLLQLIIVRDEAQVNILKYKNSEKLIR